MDNAWYGLLYPEHMLMIDFIVVGLTTYFCKCILKIKTTQVHNSSYVDSSIKKVCLFVCLSQFAVFLPQFSSLFAFFFLQKCICSQKGVIFAPYKLTKTS